MPDNEQPSAVPIREGIFLRETADGHPALIGSRDEETGQVFWPAEKVNPVTKSDGKMVPAEIPGDGHIVSYTVVQRGLPGFASPYALSAIQLDAGPSLLAQLIGWQEVEPHIGSRVALEIGTVKTERDGTIVEGPVFRVLEQESAS